jgi:hypothetical protein
MRIEFNTISRFYYSNPISLQSITHYNQPLASPLGSGSNEMVVLASYKQKRWMAQTKLNQFTQTMGPGADWSNNGDAAATLIDYMDRKVTQLDAQIGYVVNPATNATFMIGATFREAKIVDGPDLNTTNFIYLSFRTQLNNRYFDF